jgi:hypothetical protein
VREGFLGDGKINEKGRGKHVAPIMSGSHISVSFADPDLRAIGRVDEKINTQN